MSNKTKSAAKKRFSEWNPPETAPKDRAFLITTAGPNIDIAFWDATRQCFSDYFYKQPIPPKWPYMIGWKDLGSPAQIQNTEQETREANGWK